MHFFREQCFFTWQAVPTFHNATRRYLFEFLGGGSLSAARGEPETAAIYALLPDSIRGSKGRGRGRASDSAIDGEAAHQAFPIVLRQRTRGLPATAALTSCIIRSPKGHRPRPKSERKGEDLGGGIRQARKDFQ